MQTVVAEMKTESWVNDLEIHWGKDADPRHYEIHVSADGKNFERIFDSYADKRMRKIENRGGVMTPRPAKEGGKLEQKWTRVHVIGGIKPKEKSRFLKLVCHGDRKRRFSLYEVLAYSRQERNDFTAMLPPTGLNLSNRNEHGQIQDITQPVFEHAKQTANAKVDDIVDVLSRIYQLYASKVHPNDKGNTFSVDSSKTWEHHAYYQADNALRLLRYMAEGEVTDGNPRAQNLWKSLMDNRYFVYTNLPNKWKGQVSKNLQSIRNDVGRLEKKFAEAFNDIQYGFDLVYGEKTTVGFVCGVKEAVVSKGKNRWPGTCCLDAPFQNNGDNWGRKHDCSLECKTPGPFFAGINEEACSANGGSWCPNPTDCSVLKECIDEELNKAESNGKAAYYKYLEPAKVDDSKDSNSCGDARSYFGFDPWYSNDEDICDNVRQLHNTRNFGFLDEFFKQGSSGVEGDAALNWEPLNAPDRARSESDGVIENQSWRATNFAIQQTIEPISGAVETLIGLKCPGDPTGAAQTTCASIANVLFPILNVVISLLKLAHDLAEYTRESVAEPESNESIQAFENTAVLFDNMVAMDKNMMEVWKGIQGVGSDMSAAMKDSGATLQTVRDEMKEMEKSLTNACSANVKPSYTTKAEPSHRALEENESNIVVMEELGSLQTKIDKQQERLEKMDAKFDALEAMIQELLSTVQGPSAGAN